jgi:hypothetical protein
MRTYTSKSGPFTERPYYSSEEIEKMCLDELRKVGLYPSSPSPIRIDRFIEKRFKINPSYEDLPIGILGYTKFGQKGVEEIAVSRELEEENTKNSERRIKTTLAHESGHGLLHTHLFVLGQQPRSLFGDSLDESGLKILCRNDAIEGSRAGKSSRYDGRWWEHQANLVMGSLLLPRSLVMAAMEPFLVKVGLLEVKNLDQTRREEAIISLAEVFDVNPVVVRIRIDQIFPASNANQLTL